MKWTTVLPWVMTGGLAIALMFSLTHSAAPGEVPAWYRAMHEVVWGFIRHARISEAQASAFWERMAELVAEFDRLPRSGDTMYGFAVGIYPTAHPTLPARGG